MPPKPDNPDPEATKTAPVTTAASGVSGNAVSATLTLDPKTGIVYSLTILSLQLQFTGDNGTVTTTYPGTLTYDNIALLSGSQTASVSSSAGSIVVTFVQNGKLVTARFKTPGSTSAKDTEGEWGPIDTSNFSVTTADGTTSAAFPVPPLEVWNKRTPATADVNLCTDKLHNCSAGHIYYNDARNFDGEQLATVSIVGEHLNILFTDLKTNLLVGTFKSTDYLCIHDYQEWDTRGEWKNI
ncbi:hypothetical protein Clacol_004932 [Clathrus columnatus]|uniref:Uncharacterized protein n=1 Tax=Clathrus columnatus TaxID=1419009 RepID=A0AAV5AFI6_9AGAM|nr:hypothetical protein Clacol_004932 [Clathrus columnatus]